MRFCDFFIFTLSYLAVMAFIVYEIRYSKRILSIVGISAKFMKFWNRLDDNARMNLLLYRSTLIIIILAIIQYTYTYIYLVLL